MEVSVTSTDRALAQALNDHWPDTRGDDPLKLKTSLTGCLRPGEIPYLGAAVVQMHVVEEMPVEEMVALFADHPSPALRGNFTLAICLFVRAWKQLATGELESELRRARLWRVR